MGFGGREVLSFFPWILSLCPLLFACGSRGASTSTEAQEPQPQSLLEDAGVAFAIPAEARNLTAAASLSALATTKRNGAPKVDYASMPHVCPTDGKPFYREKRDWQKPMHAKDWVRPRLGKTPRFPKRAPPVAQDANVNRKKMEEIANDLDTDERIRELYRAGLNKEFVTRPLWVGLMRNDQNEKTVELLLARGADFRATDSEGKNALHIAALRCAPVSAKALIESGADVDAVDAEGRTALMLAILSVNESWDNWCLESFMRLLLELGANKEIRDEKGRTALDIAFEKNFPKGIDLLCGLGEP